MEDEGEEDDVDDEEEEEDDEQMQGADGVDDADSSSYNDEDGASMSDVDRGLRFMDGDGIDSDYSTTS